MTNNGATKHTVIIPFSRENMCFFKTRSPYMGILLRGDYKGSFSYLDQKNLGDRMAATTHPSFGADL